MLQLGETLERDVEYKLGRDAKTEAVKLKETDVERNSEVCIVLFIFFLNGFFTKIFRARHGIQARKGREDSGGEAQDSDECWMRARQGLPNRHQLEDEGSDELRTEI